MTLLLKNEAHHRLIHYSMASICGQKVHFVMSKGVSSLFEFVAAFSMVDSSCSTSTDFDASCSSSTRRVAFRRLVYLFDASKSVEVLHDESTIENAATNSKTDDTPFDMTK